MSEFSTVQPAPRGGLKVKQLTILFLLAFAAGGAGTWWLASKYGFFDSRPVAAASVAPTAVSAAASEPLMPALPPVESVANIESRLSQINADAAAASGNAVRAEGLMIAFAARRALESGAPLGYLAEQLRIRFGASQPRAVATIVLAAQSPITIQTLQGELTALEPVLISGESEEGLWSRARREMSELFVLRRDSAALPAPAKRIERAHVLVESGNIEAAIAEVSAMPGAPAARDWLTKARRYHQTRLALDLLERGALAAPAPLPPATAAAPGAADPQ